MKTLFLVVFLAVFLPIPLSAQIASQASIGEMACGPCSAVNSLLGSANDELLRALGGGDAQAKVMNFIEGYGKLKSKTYGESRTAYTLAGGTTDQDLLKMLNAFLAEQDQPAVEGVFVMRKEGESVADYVARVHGSIRQSIKGGFHPLLSVRALAAEFNKANARFVWNSKGGHWIAIHSVGELSNDGLGFMLEFSDSISGKRLTGYFNHESFRKLTVPMSFSVDENGKEIWDWQPSDNCMLLHAPGMPIGTAKAFWYERTAIAARYLILKPQGK